MFDDVFFNLVLFVFMLFQESEKEDSPEVAEKEDSPEVAEKEDSPEVAAELVNPMEA